MARLLPSASQLILFHSFLIFTFKSPLRSHATLLYKTLLRSQIFPVENFIQYSSLMASLSSRLSPSSASLNGFAMGRRPLAQSMAVLHMWGKSPNGSATCRVVCRNFVSQFHRDPLHWSKRLRRLGIAYAASTAEKTIYDYTVKVWPLMIFWYIFWKIH